MHLASPHIARSRRPVPQHRRLVARIGACLAAGLSLVLLAGCATAPQNIAPAEVAPPTSSCAEMEARHARIAAELGPLVERQREARAADIAFMALVAPIPISGGMRVDEEIAAALGEARAIEARHARICR
ncbi:hypothetical protein [Boseongicola sp. H5]|uniref:hypothetical protein n=1 Tax=Boseongicola sp. H5 TaxID=2763261 RepID=UPI001D0BD6BA|nr:hypothetical protein [Boseongicola sp. H5]